jgi:hypothetical protein
VCMDLATHCRSLVRLHFPNALIVAGRFHGIRIINYHFLACWLEIDPVGSRNRGLLALMRRHRHNLRPDQQASAGPLSGSRARTHLPVQTAALFSAVEASYPQQFCEALVSRFLRAVHQLRHAGLAQLVQLGHGTREFVRRGANPVFYDCRWSVRDGSLRRWLWCGRAFGDSAESLESLRCLRTPGSERAFGASG